MGEPNLLILMERRSALKKGALEFLPPPKFPTEVEIELQSNRLERELFSPEEQRYNKKYLSDGPKLFNWTEFIQTSSAFNILKVS